MGFLHTISEKHKAILIGLILIVLTLTVYWQVQGFDFVYYDDQVYVTENTHVLKGLTWENIKWAFTATECGFYQPLTWLTYLVDYELYGLKAGGYHWTNVIFHLMNTVLLFWVLSLMTGSLWRSGFVAALFALHPLHVESVAWIAERKDVVSGFFWMLTMLTYFFYTKTPGIYRYLLVMLVFVLGLMAKPMAITLPFVLLLLDYWPLSRFRGICTACESYADSVNRRNITNLLLEKIPLLAMALLFLAITFNAEREADALRTLDQFPFVLRLTNALNSYGAYVRKIFFPWDLVTPYSLSGNIDYWMTCLSGALILLISILVFKKLRPQPYLSVGWLWYLGTLVPVIGLVQIGAHAMGDRYTYLPLIGLFIMLTWSVADAMTPIRKGRCVLALIGALLIILMVSTSYRQVGYWKDTITLSVHAVAVTEGNYLAHHNLGGALDRVGRTDEALDQYSEAIKIMPSYADAWFNIGTILDRQKNFSQAISHYERALQLKPLFVEAYNNLGASLLNQEKVDESIPYFKKALQINPRYAEAYNNLGVAHARKGQYAESVKYFQAALRMKEDYVTAMSNLIKVRLKMMK